MQGPLCFPCLVVEAFDCGQNAWAKPDAHLICGEVFSIAKELENTEGSRFKAVKTL